MPLTADSDKTLAAASLIRAGLCDDADAGVLIIQQNGGETAGAAGIELTHLLLAMTALSVRVLLSANGFDVDKSMAVVDQWIGQYAKADSAPRP
jgi:hypothetical protein